MDSFINPVGIFLARMLLSWCKIFSVEPLTSKKSIKLFLFLFLSVAYLVSEFRPIGLYKEICKIIFKIMVQCSSQVFQKCISDEKVAYLEVKQIVNNILI